MKPLSKKEIVQAFRTWNDKDIPFLMEMYSNDHGYLIADVFVVRKKTGSGLIGVDGDGLASEFTFPIAKVWQVGKKWKGGDVEVGGLIRLKDMETRSNINPRYEEYIKASGQFKGTEMNAVNPPPQKIVQRLYEVMFRRAFVPNPFESDTKKYNTDAFFFDEGNMLMPLTAKAVELMLDPEKMR